MLFYAALIGEMFPIPSNSHNFPSNSTGANRTGENTWKSNTFRARSYCYFHFFFMEIQTAPNTSHYQATTKT